MALGLTQPLAEMSTRNISWGERRPVHRADTLTTFICRLFEIWETQTPGSLRACPGLLWDCFTYTLYVNQRHCLADNKRGKKDIIKRNFECCVVFIQLAQNRV